MGWLLQSSRQFWQVMAGDPGLAWGRLPPQEEAEVHHEPGSLLLSFSSVPN